MRLLSLFHRFERWFNRHFGWFFTNGNKAVWCMLCVLLASCTSGPEDALAALRPPIIVVAEFDGPLDDYYDRVILRDATRYVLLKGGDDLASAIVSSYQPGDTLY